jgi:hypothetical protein
MQNAEASLRRNSDAASLSPLKNLGSALKSSIDTMELDPQAPGRKHVDPDEKFILRDFAVRADNGSVAELDALWRTAANALHEHAIIMAITRESLGRMCPSRSQNYW